LPRRQREVVALRYLADLGEADTASLLGITIGSVKQHARRALEALRNNVDVDAVFGRQE
jgi:DNA-directed RNA polymerase specialized sigma24 family protein